LLFSLEGNTCFQFKYKQKIIIAIFNKYNQILIILTSFNVIMSDILMFALELALEHHWDKYDWG